MPRECRMRWERALTHRPPVLQCSRRAQAATDAFSKLGPFGECEGVHVVRGMEHVVSEASVSKGQAFLTSLLLRPATSSRDEGAQHHYEALHRS